MTQETISFDQQFDQQEREQKQAIRERINHLFDVATTDIGDMLAGEDFPEADPELVIQSLTISLEQELTQLVFKYNKPLVRDVLAEFANNEVEVQFTSTNSFLFSKIFKSFHIQTE